MKSLTRKRIALFAVAGIIVGFIAYKALDPNEPRYQRRRITEWLREYNEPPPGSAGAEAEEAIREIGPKAAPYIIRRLKADDSAWNRQYRALFPKLPSWVKKRLRAPKEPFTAHRGSAALLVIGPSVKPELIRALADDSPVVRAAAAQALWFIGHHKGSELGDTMPALRSALRDSDAEVRLFSAFALGYIGPDADSAVPDLIPLLHDPETGRQKGTWVAVRSAAARALGKIGPEARRALPSLRILLNDTNAYNSCAAAIAIWRIDADVTNTLPVLVQALSQLSEQSTWEPIEALGEMHGRAKEAFPVLLEQMNLHRTPDLAKIRSALINIDPEAAAKAGVK